MEIEKDKLSHFWSLTSNECLTLTQSNRNGLSEEEAKKRLLQFGENKLSSKKKLPQLVYFFSI
ncbi:cation transporter/ATPase N-terminal domain protein [Leptospira interrogans serovar Copenhageni str. LT2050]|uniref:Cation transporter/ATPase N-terminal domain protein n=1 Tax=Leptospira interrogans serovar Copenhageni str. LT2050 TaxID=1001598 RepID=M3HAN1_LEPIT|nr:cation transporter/ATPase N-terminal domain protein [Leptospira interrogans serovar Copenhageni str. LT2050]